MVEQMHTLIQPSHPHPNHPPKKGKEPSELLIPPRALNHPQYRPPLFQHPDFFHDLRQAIFFHRLSRNVRRDTDPCLALERVIRRQRFLTKHIQPGSCEMAAANGIEQIFLNQMRASPDVDDTSILRQLAKQLAVQNAFSVRR